jgi:hypothetical protein
MNHRLAQAALFALALVAGANAFASAEELEIDSRFRSKIAKEKVRIGAMERRAQEQGKSLDSSRCGSQNIGNIDTGGRSGAAPREVFVFAPNAINIVDGRGCR